jgi:hypothetical protein
MQLVWKIKICLNEIYKPIANGLIQGDALSQLLSKFYL